MGKKLTAGEAAVARAAAKALEAAVRAAAKAMAEEDINNDRG